MNKSIFLMFLSNLYYRYFYSIFKSFAVYKNIRLLRKEIKGGLNLDSDWKLVLRFLFWRTGITKIINFGRKHRITSHRDYFYITYG